MIDIVAAIQDANLERHHATLIRRIVKIVEELGEVSEAFLNVTSAKNGKGKTWDDVREELADLVIVALDTALTRMPDEEGRSLEDIRKNLANEIERKLQKWADNKLTGRNASDS